MENSEKLKRLVCWMRSKNMSQSTIKTYHSLLLRFFLWTNIDSCYISDQRIQTFILSIPEHYSNSYRDQVINAIRLYFIIIEKRKLNPIIIPRPIKDVFIPNILSEQQVKDVIFNTINIKHRAILFCIYDNGLRISELINLKLSDVRTKTDLPHIIIRKAKHHNSRTIPISENLLNLLKQYYWQYKPITWLFEGEGGNIPYSSTSIRNILQNALNREKINIHIRVHDLRHSFATHCLTNETNIHHLAKVLGHRNIRTTEKTYAHLQINNLKIHRAI